jgi:HEAT repeat protein
MRNLRFVFPFVAFFFVFGCGVKTPESGKLPPRETIIKYCWQTFDFGLKDKNDFVRVHTIRTMGRLGNRRAIDALSAFDFGWKPQLIKACVTTLAQQHDSAAFYGLYRYGYVKDFAVREQVVLGMARMSGLFPDTLVARYLKKILHGVDSIAVDTLLYDSTEIAADKNELKAKIGLALLKIGDRTGELYIRSAARHPSLQFRLSVANLTGEILPPNALTIVLPFLKDSSNYVRSKAVESLIKINPIDLDLRLRNLLASDRSEDVRVAAAIGLMNFDEAVAVDHLIHMLDSDDEDILSRIILTFGKVKIKPVQDKVIPLLRKLITQPSDWVRISAIAALGDLKDYDSAELIEAALSDKSQEVREISVGVLSRFKGKLMLEDLKKLVKNDEYTMRSVAIAGLGSIENDSLQNEVILPILVDRLKNDEDLVVRVRAAFTILDVLNDRKYTNPAETKE